MRASRRVNQFRLAPGGREDSIFSRVGVSSRSGAVHCCMRASTLALGFVIVLSGDQCPERKSKAMAIVLGPNDVVLGKRLFKNTKNQLATHG